MSLPDLNSSRALRLRTPLPSNEDYTSAVESGVEPHATSCATRSLHSRFDSRRLRMMFHIADAMKTPIPSLSDDRDSLSPIPRLNISASTSNSIIATIDTPIEIIASEVQVNPDHVSDVAEVPIIPDDTSIRRRDHTLGVATIDQPQEDNTTYHKLSIPLPFKVVSAFLFWLPFVKYHELREARIKGPYKWGKYVMEDIQNFPKYGMVALIPLLIKNRLTTFIQVLGAAGLIAAFLAIPYITKIHASLSVNAIASVLSFTFFAASGTSGWIIRAGKGKIMIVSNTSECLPSYLLTFDNRTWETGLHSKPLLSI